MMLSRHILSQLKKVRNPGLFNPLFCRRRRAAFRGPTGPKSPHLYGSYSNLPDF